MQSFADITDAPVVDESDRALVLEFVAEAREHIESARTAIRRMTVNANDPDAIAATFRSFHTIRGVAGFLKFQEIDALAMDAEDILDAARRGQAALTQDRFDALADALARMTSLVDGLAELAPSFAASAQTSPLVGLFARMSRLVEDLAQKTGKCMTLTCAGAETAIEPRLVRAITDPLMHLLRNAADHGIESPEERARAGKPVVGQIRLSAARDGVDIVIELRDDGRGLNRSRILLKAIAAGLVAPGAALSEAEVFNLIFHPGLTTAEQVGELSGRGVGMDVVKSNVQAVGGRVEVMSRPGAGAAFTIRLRCE